MSRKKDSLNWRILLKALSFTKPHWSWLALSLVNSVKGVADAVCNPLPHPGRDR